MSGLDDVVLFTQFGISQSTWADVSGPPLTALLPAKTGASPTSMPRIRTDAKPESVSSDVIASDADAT